MAAVGRLVAGFGDGGSNFATLARGKVMRNCEPFPYCDSTSMLPLWRLMMPKLTAKPSPNPAVPLVVKNGSNTRDLTSGYMPTPVSPMVVETVSPHNMV